MLDEQEVVRVPAAVFFRPGYVFRGLPLRMGRVGGDHRAVQVHGLQQILDLRGLGRLVGDPVLGDDRLFLVQHRGEQLDLPVPDAAQPLPVDRDRREQRFQAPRAGQSAQPAADDLVQCLRVQFLDQGADPLLAGGDDRPQQRVRRPAEPGQDLLRQVSGMVADLPEALGLGQHARHRDREDEHQREPAAPPLPHVRDQRQHLQHARNLSACLASGFIGAGHGGSGGMRDFHGGLSFRSDLA
jgi:hypothetical protein